MNSDALTAYTLTLATALLFAGPRPCLSASNIARQEAEVKKNPKSADARMALGWAYYEAGQKDRAETEFRAANALNPEHLDAYTALAAISRDKNDQREALAYFKKGLLVAAKKKGGEAAALADMSSTINYGSYAWALQDAGQQDKAIAMFKAAVKTSPDEPNYYQALSNAYAWKKKPAEALKWFKLGVSALARKKGSEKAVLSDFKSPLNYGSLGMMYLAVEQYDLAIENLNQAVNMQPNNIDFLVNLANAYQSKDRTAEYAALMKRALELTLKQKGSEKAALSDLNSPVNYISMGWVYSQTKEYDKAISSFRQALTLAPDNLETYLQIARIFEEQNKNTEAVAWANKALSVRVKAKGSEKAALSDMRSPLNYSSLADIYKGARQYAKAVELYQAAAKVEPGNSAHYKNVSDCYAAQARYELALEWIKKAIVAELKKTKN